MVSWGLKALLRMRKVRCQACVLGLLVWLSEPLLWLRSGLAHVVYTLIVYNGVKN